MYFPQAMTFSFITITQPSNQGVSINTSSPSTPQPHMYFSSRPKFPLWLKNSVINHAMDLVLCDFCLLQSFLSFSLTFMTLTLLKNTGHLFCRMSLNLVLYFLMIRFKFCFLGRCIAKVMLCSPHSVPSGGERSYSFLYFDLLIKVVSARLLHCKIISLHLVILWMLCKYATVIKLLSYFYPYGFVVSYFIQCVQIYAYHFFGYSCCPQFGQWDSFPAGFCVPLPCSYHFSLSQDVPVSSCTFPAPPLKLAISKELWFPLVEKPRNDAWPVWLSV